MLQTKNKKSVPDQSGTVIPDFHRPDAIMVPHYRCEITSLLENIASTISSSCGVILLSSDKTFSQAFIEAQKKPKHFSIVTASLDSPWIRDRSPLPIKTSAGIRWCNPRMGYMGRPNDDSLFDLISIRSQQVSPIEFLAHGNMVAGSRGLMLVSSDVLKSNDLTTAKLESYKEAMGVHQWLVFTGFKREITGHADVHVRVLKARLIAVAWNLSVKADRDKTLQLINKIKQYDPLISIIKIPIRSVGKQYASLVNWIQIGKRLLVPRFDITTTNDILQTTKALAGHGFKAEYIYSPTLSLGGSLHCLTASIYT